VFSIIANPLFNCREPLLDFRQFDRAALICLGPLTAQNGETGAGALGKKKRPFCFRAVY
jgi:hypothetical protein